MLTRSTFRISVALALTMGATIALAGGFSEFREIKPAIDLVPKTVGPVVDKKAKTDKIKIIDHDEVAFVGKIDIGPTLKRIRENERLESNNDGTVFGNRERRLPSQPRGYYREFVHWPVERGERFHGIRFPGPMRVVLGRKGEVYFTGDHYDSFLRVN